MLALRLEAVKMGNSLLSFHFSKWHLPFSFCLLSVPHQCLKIPIFYALFRVHSFHLQEGCTSKRTQSQKSLNQMQYSGFHWSSSDESGAKVQVINSQKDETESQGTFLLGLILRSQLISVKLTLWRGFWIHPQL